MAKAKEEPTKEADLVVESVTEGEAPEVVIEKEEVSEAPAKATAKAGKRSAKAVKETEEKEAKEARKKDTADKSAEAKKPAPKARSKAERAGKKYREAAKLIEKDKLYTAKGAVELAVKTSPTKFDATVELHINLGVDPRQADQNVRDTVSLPAGTGKTIRVAVFSDDAAKAKAAGADVAGVEEVTKLLDKEDLAFDTLIAPPNMMAALGKYARLLGPRGLMPNPKSGTVTADIETAVKEAKAGKVEYRVDATGIVHLGIGKVSFGSDKLAQNYDAIMTSIRSNKPASVKGIYIKAITLTTTMGPGIKIETT